MVRVVGVRLQLSSLSWHCNRGCCIMCSSSAISHCSAPGRATWAPGNLLLPPLSSSCVSCSPSSSPCFHIFCSLSHSSLLVLPKVHHTLALIYLKVFFFTPFLLLLFSEKKSADTDGRAKYNMSRWGSISSSWILLKILFEKFHLQQCVWNGRVIGGGVLQRSDVFERHAISWKWERECVGWCRWLQMDRASCYTVIVGASAPLHILQLSLMYTHVSSSFLCVTLRGLLHAPFPFVHNVFCFSISVCFSSLALSLTYCQRPCHFGKSCPLAYTTNLARARGKHRKRMGACE